MSEAFKLATVSSAGSPPFVALVMDDRALSLDRALQLWGAGSPRRRQLRAPSMLDLLGDWEANFTVLQEFVAFAAGEGLNSDFWRGASAPLATLAFLAPVPRPPKMLYAAINYPRPGRQGREEVPPGARPNMFEKSSSAVIGPYDDVLKPEGYDKIDWEVELALVIGTRAKAIPEARALDCVAGFLTANDVTVRDFRKPGELTVPGPDWFGSKCHDTFAPLGPYIVPRAFVRDCHDLRLTLKVNGETRQDASTREMIFSPEEQVSHVSRQLTLEPGDIISTGTPNGIGMQLGFFLKVGDVMEAEVEGLGAQRNRLVA
ncbi:MAG TPA: fumarylacetoacetate hydrolase family protein [Stellaceae bacterium]|nr:fumarylacetoacetate hydrolase family protein [Stellaceae bacterium]